MDGEPYGYAREVEIEYFTKKLRVIASPDNNYSIENIGIKSMSVLKPKITETVLR